VATQMSVARYCMAPVVAIALSIAVWIGIIDLHPMFWRSAILVPTIIAGILGGVAAAMIFPKRKALSACLVGILLTGCILFLLFRHSFGHSRPNPWLWYWPIWLIPTYAIGGFLGRRYWKAV
jgi:hypothetical protein